MGILDKFKKKETKRESKQEEKQEKPIPGKFGARKKRGAAAVKKVEKKEEEKPREVVKTKARSQSLAYRILKKPLISEKASVLSETGKYVFIVDKKAKKQEVKRVIFSVYGIKPAKINFVNIKGKFRRYGKIVGQTSDYKKAIVTLPKGKAIQVHEGV